MWMWEAIGRYADGTEIEKYFPYNEDDRYALECEKQFKLEEWLINAHEDCIFYSVECVEKEDEQCNTKE